MKRISFVAVLFFCSFMQGMNRKKNEADVRLNSQNIDIAGDDSSLFSSEVGIKVNSFFSSLKNIPNLCARLGVASGPLQDLPGSNEFLKKETRISNELSRVKIARTVAWVVKHDANNESVNHQV